MKLNVVIAESALELVPDEIRRHASVVNDARRRGVEASRILLDRSIHHAAMERLRDGLKRGRPDLVQITLLSITSTPLYREGDVKVYIHTFDDRVLELKEGTRPPKNYARFRNLMEKLLLEMPSEGLIRAYDSSLPSLVRGIGGDEVVGLSIQGRYRSFEELGAELVARRNPVVLIGGFARGHFLPTTLKAVDELVRVDESSLDAHVVASRLVYEVEKNRGKGNQR